MLKTTLNYWLSKKNDEPLIEWVDLLLLEFPPTKEYVLLNSDRVAEDEYLLNWLNQDSKFGESLSPKKPKRPKR